MLLRKNLVLLTTFSSHLPCLAIGHISHLARFQLRCLSQDCGLDLVAMSDVAIPAFYAAHLRHFRQIKLKAVGCPCLPSA